MTVDKKMQSNPAVQIPHHERESNLLQGDDNYLSDGENIFFPGPLMSKIQMEDVMRFIQRKSQECLQKVEEPDQKETYFFWKVMELRCSKNGKAELADAATVLFKNYRLLKKRRAVKNQDSWCLSLAKLLCSADPEDEILDALIRMGQDLDSRGLTYAAQLCYVAATEELQILQSPSFELIGCNSLPIRQSAIREAIERTEVYEYICSLTTGLPQPNFQIFKCYHASRLAELGLFDQALEYCEAIATAIATLPRQITKTTMKMTIALSEKLHQGKEEEPEWLVNLRQLYADGVYKLKNSERGLMTSEMFSLQRPRQEGHITPWEVFESLYTPGELLGEGGFGSVCAGVRNADGKQPGETNSLPLEVALMQMVSKPYCHENVLELIEWFEMSDCFILILERPIPCTDLRKFLKGHKGRLSESLAKHIMRQVVQAARHCSECGVLHRDIKPENILINTDTHQLKLIDFGCGDLLQDTPYRYYAGTRAYFPPEWICEGEYMGDHATVWSLGVLLFDMVCGELPFWCEKDIVARDLHFANDLSEGCRDLIQWCLELYPHWRPTYEQILSHQWFEEPKKNVKNLCPLPENIITPWEVFESLYTPGEMLGEGGFGTVHAGIRNADGKQVAIKHLRKDGSDLYITVLVLKDVMKVKGQVSEVAALLLDPEPHIDNLAVNFFNELAAKDNAIYNLLPDIISRLSDPERGMKEEDFSTVMKQLFSYITKERQTESLVEKLCQRFRTAKTERQWADIAVSLSLLSMCERGFKKLQECWECYSDKLTEDAVYQPLLSILAKLRRRAEPQFKAQVEEFEKKLTAVHTKGLEDVENEEREQQLEKQKNTPVPKSARRPTRGRGKSQMDDSDLVTPKTSHARPKTVITFSSDEEEEEEDAVMAESETPKVTTPISRTRRTHLHH
ncbi:hypothetical protein KOW79_007154 [Hemibagrus wyckioides]|uniref:non-specific serine/threonine protein kinase n=2 Tax=Hemibagrus wyckioides TaxID=337641 RepID=A0A9D3NXI0_9TELE|nr:hypothetical protein KOW79_007154 [Hemibagrus wyckioides]